MSERIDTESLQENTDAADQELLPDVPKRKRIVLKLYTIACYLLIYGGVFVFASYIMPTYVCGKVTVDGNSMKNTLHHGDHLIDEKLSYHFESPQRFDIVIVTPYTTAAEATSDDSYWVKRIIGLPGETIQIKGGRVYIDDKLLEEDIYGSGDISYAGIAEDGYKIPPGEYFLMGDNRIGQKSYDSRYEEVGTFREEQIVGKVIFRISPKFGAVE